jgi:GT2 family glycosyltransferase
MAFESPSEMNWQNFFHFKLGEIFIKFLIIPIKTSGFKTYFIMRKYEYGRGFFKVSKKMRIIYAFFICLLLLPAAISRKEENLEIEFSNSPKEKKKAAPPAR